jgi:Holliday junction resolvasome RuvABC endonuclease subunit
MILGISPGTRTFGFVVLRDGEIKTCGVKSYKEKWSDGKLIHILYGLSQLIHRHKIREVAVKVPDVFPRSSGYAQLIGAMNVLFESRGIKARYYTLSELTKRHDSKRKVNKEALVAYVAHRYPELLPLYRKEQTAAKPYYEKVFEAVLAAHNYKPNNR